MLKTLPACKSFIRVILEKIADAMNQRYGDCRLKKRVDVLWSNLMALQVSIELMKIACILLSGTETLLLSPF
jgi:hypothetical protein